MVLVALVPLVIMAVQGYHCARESILEGEAGRLRSVLDGRRARLDDWLNERREELVTLASYPCARQDCTASLSRPQAQTAEALCHLLDHTHAPGTDYESLVVYDARWRRVAWSHQSVHHDADLLTPDFVRAVSNTTHVVATPPHAHEEDATLIGIHLGYVVRDEAAKVSGYIVAALMLCDTLYPILEDRSGIRETCKVYLLSPSGTYLSEPQATSGLLGSRAAVPRAVLAGEQDRVARYRDWRGNKVLAISTSLPEFGWVLVAEIDETEAFRWLGVLRVRALFTGMATLLVIVLVAGRRAEALTRPFRQLSATAQRITAGNRRERVHVAGGTEATETAESLNTMLDELARMHETVARSAALSAVGELSARVVHEMRNPLSSVKMNLKALREKVADDATYSELAEIASGQVERLERMLTDLLQYGKPLELRKEPMIFGELAEEVRAALAQQADADGVELTVRDDTDARSFTADREQMRRAVTNLVDNAVRASPRGGNVVVSGRMTGKGADEEVAISVRDTGPGIAQHLQEKLFEPFFTTRSEGTGLGLANVRKIVELHGGTVSAENLPEAGASFTLTLPREDWA